MKKIFALLITIMILFTACQPTPENPVVVNKANGELEKKIQQTATPTLSAEPEAVVTTVPLELVQRTFLAKDEKVKIIVDTQVALPSGNLPVVLIEPADISLEFIEKAAEFLLQGKPLYEPRTQLTKDEIEQKILELKFAIENPEQSKSDGLRSGDPQIVAEVTEMFKDRIKIYQGMLDNAPEEYVPAEAVIEFKPSKYYISEQRYKEGVAQWTGSEDKQAKQLLRQYDEEMQIVLDANLDDGYYGRITASNFTGDLSRWNTLKFIKSKTLNENTFQPILEIDSNYVSTLSKEEAKDMMKNLIEDLGLDNMVLADFQQREMQNYDENCNLIGEKNVIGYYGVFQREYYGIPAFNSLNRFGSGEDDQYRPRYIRESIVINIYEDEIFSFKWDNPARIVQLENENVMTIPFRDIMDIFQQQMSLIYNVEKISRDAPSNDGHKELIDSIEYGQINITKIILGMERIPVENDINRYRMVPVWRFFGNEHLKIKGRENDFLNMPDEEFAYLTINAIDGSVVDFQSGY